MQGRFNESMSRVTYFVFPHAFSEDHKCYLDLIGDIK